MNPTGHRLIPLFFVAAACVTGPTTTPDSDALAPGTGRVAGDAPAKGRTADAKRPADPAAAIRALAEPLVEHGWIHGAVVGVVQPDGELILGFGRTGLEGAAPDADTLFEIGSITKVFTGLVLADAVTRGEVRLDTPVASLVPFEVPAWNGVGITLGHLSSHASGLPRMPEDFAPGDPANPYADYDAERLAASLAKHALTREPGTRAEYSNLGAGLLGHALAVRAGTTYEALVRERLLAPLGMSDTAIVLQDDQRARFAAGFDGEGHPAPAWDVTALAGAGALRSTMRDMLRFVRANLRPADAPLSGALALAQTPRAPHDASNQLGLGWMITGNGIVWHNGQTGGYHSFMALVPAEGLGVVVLSNTATPHVDALGQAVLRMLRGRPYAIDLPSFVEVSEGVLERYVGVYEIAPGLRFAVTLKAGTLRAQLTGQPALTIHPVSETEFLYRVVPARISFQAGTGGEVTGLVLHQNGRDTPAKRVEQ